MRVVGVWIGFLPTGSRQPVSVSTVVPLSFPRVDTGAHERGRSNLAAPRPQPGLDPKRACVVLNIYPYLSD